MARQRGAAGQSLHVARDDARLAKLARRPCASSRRQVEVLVFPAWDCLPYDRVSPHRDIVAERLDTLAGLPRLKPARRAGAHRPDHGRGAAAARAAAEFFAEVALIPLQGRRHGRSRRRSFAYLGAQRLWPLGDR